MDRQLQARLRLFRASQSPGDAVGVANVLLRAQTSPDNLCASRDIKDLLRLEHKNHIKRLKQKLADIVESYRNDSDYAQAWLCYDCQKHCCRAEIRLLDQALDDLSAQFLERALSDWDIMRVLLVSEVEGNPGISDSCGHPSVFKDGSPGRLEVGPEQLLHKELWENASMEVLRSAPSCSSRKPWHVG